MERTPDDKVKGQPREIVIAVDSDGSITLDGEPISMEDLRQHVKLKTLTGKKSDEHVEGS
jgi:biopolymer transport protein ExbD